MNNKLIFAIAVIVLFTGMLTVFMTVANAKSFFCFKKQNIIVTLRNDVNIDKVKGIIAKIPQVKIKNIKNRNEEWSKYVNKYDDLPKMDNPFKNKIILKPDKNANITEILNKINEIDFVEKAEYVSDSECQEKQK